MAKFCPNCGKNISDKVKFCPECGEDISSFDLTPHDTPIVKDKKIEREIRDQRTGKKVRYEFILLGIGLILLIVVFCILIVNAFFSGMQSQTDMQGSQSQYLISTPVPSTPKYIAPTPTESQTDRNIRIAKEIVADYHNTHTYSLNDFYVCGDMASDVWDMLKTQGINAKLNVGRVDRDVTNIKDANHVWVLAEVAPNSYLALETTGGYSVEKANNPRYYYGWSFYNPKQLKNYMQLSKQYNDAVAKYNAALNDYNYFVNQYKEANFLTQLAWKGQLDDKKLILNQRTQDLNDINLQISALLSSL